MIFPPTAPTRYTDEVMKHLRPANDAEQSEIKKFNRRYEKCYEDACKLWEDDREVFIEILQKQFPPNTVLRILFGSVQSGKSRLKRVKKKHGAKGPRHQKPKKRK